MGPRLPSSNGRPFVFAMRRWVIGCTGFFGWVDAACADGAPLDRRVHGGDWNLDPVILFLLMTAAWFYVKGLLNLWERTGFGRVVRPGQAIAFTLGLALLSVALLSPLDPLSDQLAAAHMVQHMLLATVCAPLIVVGAPALVGFWGLQAGTRKCWRSVRHGLPSVIFGRYVLWNPLFAWSLYTFTLTLWHLPAWYTAALRYPMLHDLQHVSFFATAVWFWRVLLDPLSRFRLSAGLAILMLFATTMQATVLGVLMTLAPAPWYPLYESRAVLWGLTALEDQQLAGLIMWMPACATYLGVALLLLMQLMNHDCPPKSLSRRLPAGRYR